MPILKNFVYCQNASNQEGKNDVFGVLAAMTPEYVPGLFSFSVYFTVLNLSAGDHLLTLLFKDPDETVVATVDRVPIQYVPDESCVLPAEYTGVNIAANLQNVNIKYSGLYKTEVILDGQSLGEFDIYIKGKKEC